MYVFNEYLTPKRAAYAPTVKRGDNALMVWTVLTGILEIAILENMWPPTWNAPIGRVVIKILRVGYRSRENCIRGDMKMRQ